MTHNGSSDSTAEAIVHENDPLVDRFDLIYLLRRYRWMIVAVPLACALIAGVLVKLRPSLYRSSVLIYIDPKFDQIMRLESVEGSSASDLDSLTSLEIMIVADTMILQVVDHLGLRDEEGFLPKDMAENPDLPDQKLVGFLQKNRFSAELVEGTRLLKITVRDPSPARAQRIAGCFAKEFDQFLVTRRQEEAKRARAAFEVQVATAREAARESEQLLREFRETHPQFPVEQDHDMFAVRLTQISNDLNTVESQRMELESQVEFLKDIDAESSPLVVFKVAGYESHPYVSDLLRLRAASAARLAAADQVGSERDYKAIESEFQRHQEQIRQTAAEVKLALESNLQATLKREGSLRTRLEGVQGDLVMVKSLSSEFRALYQQAERRWLAVENLQNHLSESVIAMDSQSNIATEVSQPLKPYKAMGSNGILMLLVGGVVGGLISLTWIGGRFLIGLPYTHRSQLDRRFDVPLLADWSDGKPGANSISDAVLLHALGEDGAKIVQFVAPGNPQLGKSVAKRVARMTADAGEKTLLVILNSKPVLGGARYEPRSIGSGDLVQLDAPAQAAINGDVLEHYLLQHGDEFSHIFVEGGGASNDGVTRWLATLSDKNVVVVAAGCVAKNTIDHAIEELCARGMPPVELMLAGEQKEKAPAASHSIAEPAFSPFEGERANAG